MAGFEKRPRGLTRVLVRAPTWLYRVHLGRLLGGRFVLGTGGTIDPASQPVAFAVGNDAVRLPAGSFVPDSVGYVYQKTINGIARYIHIKFTSTPGIYQLVALRKGGTLTSTTSPVPVTLIIGDDSGSTQMKTTFF